MILEHWDDPEGWYGEGGGRRVQDGVLDEPNTYIDKRFEAKLYSLLEEINRERAIILVSHDIGTVLKNVKTIACVNETVHYHPHTEVPTEWLEEHFGCPIEMLGHGTFPHRVLKCHHEH